MLDLQKRQPERVVDVQWTSTKGVFMVKIQVEGNIVVSRDPAYTAPGATVVDSLDDALDLARQEAIPDAKLFWA